MNSVFDTVSTGDLKVNPAAIVRKVEESGPVTLMNRTTPVAIIVSVEEWNQIAKRMKSMEEQLLKVAQRKAGEWDFLDSLDEIAARNDANDSWVSNEEVEKIFADVHVKA